MEIYLIGCLIALLATVVIMTIRENFEVTSGDIGVLLGVSALSWLGVAVCLPLLIIIFLESEATLYKLYVVLQDICDKCEEICKRQEQENNKSHQK